MGNVKAGIESTVMSDAKQTFNVDVVSEMET